MGVGSMTVGQVELAAIFRVSRRTVQRWVREGMPQRPNTTYDLTECVGWVRDRERAALRKARRRSSSSALELRELLPEARRLVCELRRLELVHRATIDAGHQD